MSTNEDPRPLPRRARRAAAPSPESKKNDDARPGAQTDEPRRPSRRRAARAADAPSTDESRKKLEDAWNAPGTASASDADSSPEDSDTAAKDEIVAVAIKPARPKTPFKASRSRREESAEREHSEPEHAELEHAELDAPTGTGNLGMVTPLEFETAEDGSRGAMKAPPTSSIPIISVAPKEAPAAAVPDAQTAPAEETPRLTAVDAAKQAVAPGAENLQDEESFVKPAGAPEEPSAAVHSPVPAGESQGLDPVDPKDEVSARQRMTTGAVLIGGGIAAVGAAVVYFFTR